MAGVVYLLNVNIALEFRRIYFIIRPAKTKAVEVHVA
jgi:hypothetical protein